MEQTIEQGVEIVTNVAPVVTPSASQTQSKPSVIQAGFVCPTDPAEAMECESCQ